MITNAFKVMLNRQAGMFTQLEITRCASACAASAPPAWLEPLPPRSRTVAAGRRGEGPLEFLTGFIKTK